MTATATKTKASSITIPKAELLAAMLAVKPAVPTRSPKPILQNVRIGDGLVTGTDLEIRIDRQIGERCDPFLVPFGRLLAILRVAQGQDVMLTPKDTSVSVKCGRGRWELPTESELEFPTWEPSGLEPLCRLPADQFARAARATAYATDNESSRYALGAVLLEVRSGNPTWVATDGRRLACVETETDQAVDDREVLVPSRLINIVVGLLKKKKKSKDDHADEDDSDERYEVDPSFGSVQVEASQKEVVFTLDDVTVTGRMTEGRFPRWRDVIGEVDGEPSVLEVAELLSAVRAAAIVTSEQSKGVDFEWTSNTLAISAKSSEYGESVVKCPIVAAGSTSSTKLDPRYVAEYLSRVPSDEEPQVNIWATNRDSRVLLKCGVYTAVIMPLAKD